MFDTHELGRRPGALQRLTRTVDAPKDLGIKDVIGVPEGAPVELELRLESVMGVCSSQAPPVPGRRGVRKVSGAAGAGAHGGLPGAVLVP
ncbi:hypothetical protein SHKM778_20390 [Streptomyces sp. KM77-8]|uniref:Uncharacterized protein n=1 Tax=Streptomyces haneummycinicus TaxID=3074435 RepID=A0AAT9HE28_9ACTN